MARSPLAHSAGDKLLQYLLVKHPEETRKAAAACGFSLADLSGDAPRGHFSSRQAKIIKVATHLRPRVNTSHHFLSLMRTAGAFGSASPRKRLHLVPELGQTTLLEYSTPTDLMDASFKREQAKFDRGKHVLRRIDQLKTETSKWKENKLHQRQSRLQKLSEERHRRQEELEKAAADHSVLIQSRLETKRRIMHNLDKASALHGQQVEARLALLTEKKQAQLRQQLLDEQRKIKERIRWEFKKQELTLQEIEDEEIASLQALDELLVKQQARIEKYQDNISERVQCAHDHGAKVQQRLIQILEHDDSQTESKLHQAVQKSLDTTNRQAKKHSLVQSEAQRMRQMLGSSFDRHLNGKREQEKIAQQRIRAAITRVGEVDRVRDRASRSRERGKARKAQHNSQRAQEHAANYLRAREEQMRFKERILEKHMRATQVVNHLNQQRHDLSYKGRADHLELRRLRSQQATPAK